jgi:hypothetical protein
MQKGENSMSFDGFEEIEEVKEDLYNGYSDEEEDDWFEEDDDDDLFEEDYDW